MCTGATCSNAMAGARISLLVGLVGALVSLMIGVLWGATAGLLEWALGQLDDAHCRCALPLPSIILRIVIIRDA